MKMMSSTIIWTQTDEAPALVTYSLLPIVRAFTRGTGVAVETRDISLAGRITPLSQRLDEDRAADDLAWLGRLTGSQRQPHQAAEHFGLHPRSSRKPSGTAGEVRRA